jgi:5'-deoxynucleotidase YfbR-like HD superfamily hydrolase
MPNEHSVPEILNQIEFLIRKYSLERRAMTQPYLLGIVQQKVDGYQYNPEDILVRETLIEHVGFLPILAIALYPYIDDSDVDLGDALTMLAIHDIGELVIGDENVFTKKSEDKDAEYQAGLKLLHPHYHSMYEDIENKISKSAKFAKAIDKLAPDIIDYLTPANITTQRLKYFANFEPDQIVAKIIEFKRPYMTWNPFMETFHCHLMKKLDVKLRE